MRRTGRDTPSRSEGGKGIVTHPGIAPAIPGWVTGSGNGRGQTTARTGFSAEAESGFPDLPMGGFSTLKQGGYSAGKTKAQAPIRAGLTNKGDGT